MSSVPDYPTPLCNDDVVQLVERAQSFSQPVTRSNLTSSAKESSEFKSVVASPRGVVAACTSKERKSQTHGPDSTRLSLHSDWLCATLLQSAHAQMQATRRSEKVYLRKSQLANNKSTTAGMP